jgi:hypothetical protein
MSGSCFKTKEDTVHARDALEARKALAEAMHIFLITAVDMGTLDDLLQEAGYELEVFVLLVRKAATIALMLN